MKFIPVFLSIFIVLLAFVLFGGAVLAQAQTQPAGTPLQVMIDPSRIQTTAVNWINAATAIVTALAALATVVLVKFTDVQRQIKDVKQDTTDRLNSHGDRINAIAMASPPPSTVVVNPAQPQQQ